MDGKENVKERQKQINVQLEIQKRHLVTLEKVSATLKERLCPASQHQTPQAEAKGEQEDLVPIAGELRENNDLVQAVVVRLEGMIDRLEL